MRAIVLLFSIILLYKIFNEPIAVNCHIIHNDFVDGLFLNSRRAFLNLFVCLKAIKFRNIFSLVEGKIL